MSVEHFCKQEVNLVVLKNFESDNRDLFWFKACSAYQDSDARKKTFRSNKRLSIAALMEELIIDVLVTRMFQQRAWPTPKSVYTREKVAETF